MLVERTDRCGADVRCRADVADDAAIGEFGKQDGIIDCADAVPDPVGMQRIERPPYGRRSRDLAGMGPSRARQLSRYRNNGAEASSSR
jgi:hypothetical protein